MFILSRLMPKIGGPQEASRHLLVSVMQSILLYGSPMWTPTLTYNPRGVETLARFQCRAAIRSACAYRRVSYDAVQVVARTSPIDLLAVEHGSAYSARKKMISAANGRSSGSLVTSGGPRT